MMEPYANLTYEPMSCVVLMMLVVWRSEARAARPLHHQPMEGQSGPPLLARRWLHSGSREVVLVCPGGSISHQLPTHANLFMYICCTNTPLNLSQSLSLWKRTLDLGSQSSIKSFHGIPSSMEFET